MMLFGDSIAVQLMLGSGVSDSWSARVGRPCDKDRGSGERNWMWLGVGLWGGRSEAGGRRWAKWIQGNGKGKVSQSETCEDKDARVEGTQREAGMRVLQWLEGGDLCKQPSGQLRSQQTHI